MQQYQKVSSLALSENGRIWVGGNDDIGYLKVEQNGGLRFVSLMERIGAVQHSSIEPQNIFCTSHGTLFITSERIYRWYQDSMYVVLLDNPVLASFFVSDTLYVQQEKTGLHYMSLSGKNAFVPVTISGGDMFNDAVRVASMLEQTDCIVIVASNQGLFTLKECGIRKRETGIDSLLKSSSITSAVFLKDGSLALGTMRRGIIILSKTGSLLTILGSKDGLLDDYVRKLYIDDASTMWAALNNGIAQIEIPSPFSFYDVRRGLEGGVAAITRCDNRLYIGTYKGLYGLNTVSGNLDKIQGISSTCWSLSTIGNIVFAATSQGLFRIYDTLAEKITSEFTHCIYHSRLKSDIAYIGQSDGLFFMKLSSDPDCNVEKLSDFSRQITDIAEDTSGALWINTSDNSLIRMQPDNFEQITEFGTDQGLPSNTGNKLNHVANTPCIATFKGMFTFNAHADSFEDKSFFGSNNMKYQESIFKMTEDYRGNIYTFTFNQTDMARFEIRDSGGYYLNRQPFLQISDWVINNSFSDSDGTMWFGGPEGLIRYDPSQDIIHNRDYATIIRKVTNSDSLIFDGAFFSEELTAILKQPEYMRPVFAYDAKEIHFEFAALSYTITSLSKGGNVFRYFLEGFDNTWSDWTSIHTKEYNNLPNKKYLFMVEARNVYGDTSSIASYSFSITAPLYKRWWVITFYILLFIGFIFFIVILRSRKLLKEKVILENLIQQRTREVVVQKEELVQQSLELESKNDELEKINIILKSINSQIQFISLLRSILDEIIILKGVEAASVLVLEKESSVFRFRISVGREMQTLNRLEFSIDAIRRIFLSNAEEVYEDIYIDNHFKAAADADNDKFRNPKSVVIMAVKVDAHEEGFILLENLSAEGVFVTKEISLLRSLKEHIISAFIKSRIMEDLENTLKELKEAQTRLVQSEKLASLGQLTAGIAHEIQNPLNFVINFSKISIDLVIDLLEYVEKEKTILTNEGYMEIKDTLYMLSGNMAKISDHGKRAESIVKGMLQHSRGGPGEFADTDINAMVKEYVNLSYHGMRAQDKEFNVKFIEDYGEDVGRIQVVPQDLSRVVLNIVNNACYAVNEKRKNSDGSYSPELTITTRKVDNTIKILFKDNGSGMPDSIRDKIFNPFFTTKPTGKGTGLGLSMSYDIVTHIHKGTIEVTSQEGEFTQFVISIPCNLSKSK
ncbi:MAG: hypothetical protein JW913_20720 [Chitinispirillaceae bacterium]|nr:hypothetical protein [Chitinispirillaceae bacterium]